MTFKIGPLAALVMLSACAGTPPLGGSPAIDVVESGIMPEPTTYLDATGSLVGPYDILLVDVFGIEEFGEREMQVDSTGFISYPLAGTVLAAGRTTDQIAEDVRLRLRDAHVRNPQVTVNIKEVNSQLVTVDGEVMQPGMYPVRTSMTLMRAVASAKGLSEVADPKDVVLMRTVNGQKYAALYNLALIRRGTYEDPRIYPDDMVIVSHSRARELFRDLVALAPIISTPLVVALQN